MMIYPIQSIESANGKLGNISPPSNPNGDVSSMSLKAKKEHLLRTSHQRMSCLMMVALLAAVLGMDPTVRAQDIPQKGNSMEAIGLLVALEARPGKEADAEAFLKSAQPLAQDEKGTLKWYAIKLGPGKFGIFDTFANKGGRNAHLTGEIAKAAIASPMAYPRNFMPEGMSHMYPSPRKRRQTSRYPSLPLCGGVEFSDDFLLTKSHESFVRRLLSVVSVSMDKGLGLASISEASANACVSIYSRMFVSLPFRTVMAKTQWSSNVLFVNMTLPLAKPITRTRSL